MFLPTTSLLKEIERFKGDSGPRRLPTTVMLCGHHLIANNTMLATHLLNCEGIDTHRPEIITPTRC